MGKVFIGGGKPDMTAPVPPSKAIPGSEFAVGTSVYLRENGVLAEYLIVNQGIPSNSSLYDSSCNGTWLLRKDIYGTQRFHTAQSNGYAGSSIKTYLDSTFLALFDSNVQSAIKQVKIPVGAGGASMTVSSGSSGLSTKVFLLGGYEVGWTSATSTVLPIDGACLSYFSGASNTKRIAYLDGTATSWWTRTPRGNMNYTTFAVSTSGINTFSSEIGSVGVRPALVLPSTALFDSNTMEFLGVA